MLQQNLFDDKVEFEYLESVIVKTALICAE